MSAISILILVLWPHNPVQKVLSGKAHCCDAKSTSLAKDLVILYFHIHTFHIHFKSQYDFLICFWIIPEEPDLIISHCFFQSYWRICKKYFLLISAHIWDFSVSFWHRFSLCSCHWSKLISHFLFLYSVLISSK
jgi:hypothetical protein